MPKAEVSNVRAVKRRLQKLHGLPSRFRQRLIFQGTILDDDDDKLESSLDLVLVLQPFSIASQTQADELVAAAEDGSVDKAGLTWNMH